MATKIKETIMSTMVAPIALNALEVTIANQAGNLDRGVMESTPRPASQDAVSVANPAAIA